MAGKPYASVEAGGKVEAPTRQLVTLHFYGNAFEKPAGHQPIAHPLSVTRFHATLQAFMRLYN